MLIQKGERERLPRVAAATDGYSKMYSWLAARVSACGEDRMTALFNLRTSKAERERERGGGHVWVVEPLSDVISRPSPRGSMPVPTIGRGVAGFVQIPELWTAYYPPMSQKRSL